MILYPNLDYKILLNEKNVNRFFGILAYVIKADIPFCSKSQEAACIVYFVHIFLLFTAIIASTGHATGISFRTLDDSKKNRSCTPA